MPIPAKVSVIYFRKTLQGVIIMMYTYTFEVDERDRNFLEAYAEETGESVGEMAKNVLLEHVEDIMDARAADIAWAEYEADPVTYTLDEVESELIGNAV